MYNTVFENIAKEEVKSAEHDVELQDKLPSVFPNFGTSTSDLSNVKAFYTLFMNFTTVMDFSWADMHNVNRAPDRKVTFIIMVFHEN